MRLLRTGVVAAIALLSTAAVGKAQSARNWGAEWKAAPALARSYYVAGLQMDNMNVHRVEYALSGGLTVPELDSAVKTLSAKQRAALAKGVGRVFSRLEVERAGVDVVVETLDGFYRDASNSLVPWHEMAEIAVLKLGGATAFDIDRELAIARQAAIRRL